MLTYLAVEADRPHRRERLAGLLWPEWPDRAARSNLRYALSNLRQAIGNRQAATPFLHISRETIQLNSGSDTWVDVTALTRLLETPAPTIRESEEAVDLYREEFLEGFSCSDSAAFEEWVLFKREQIGRRVLSALHRLAATYEERGEYRRALPYAWRQVELEPWREDAHRQLMRLLAFNGQRGAALAQYEACRRALAEQLDVEPAAEMTRLYEQIRDGEEIDRGQAKDVSLAHEAQWPQNRSEGLVESPSSAQRDSSRQRMAGGRLARVGGGLLLLVLVGAILVFAARGGFGAVVSPEVFTPPTPVEALPFDLAQDRPGEGKILGVCEDTTHPQICVYDGRIERLIQVIDCREFEHVGPLASWSPDGQQIVFDGNPRSSPAKEHKLYVTNADGSGLRQVTSGDTNDMLPTWSPDGQWTAFHHNGELWIIHPDGLGAQRLLERDRFHVWVMAWSPDSQQIVFLKKIEMQAFNPDEIWVINRDGTASRLVHSFEQPSSGVLLAWSPDDRQIVCHREFEQGVMVLLMNADGSGEPQVIGGTPWSQWSEVGLGDW